MTPVVVAVAAVAGALAGLGSGAAAVQLERIEGLESEEAEERAEYERDAARAAAGDGAPPPPWKGDSYGWTYLEWLVSPVAGAAGFAAFAAHEDVGRGLLIHLLWVTVFVHILAFDVKHRLILNRVTFPALAVALAVSQASPGLTAVHAVVGAVAVFVFFMVQSLILGGEKLGMGDAKLGALVGAVTGLGMDPGHFGAIYAVVAAAISAGVVAMLLLVTRVRGLRDPIPYGPFLCAGAALIIFTGPAAG